MKEKTNEKENEKSWKEVLTEGDKFGILLKLSQDSRAERKHRRRQYHAEHWTAEKTFEKMKKVVDNELQMRYY